MAGREAVGIGIEAGDVLLLNAWSRLQTTLRANIRVRPVAGTKAFAIPIELTAPVGGGIGQQIGKVETPGVIDSVMIQNNPKAGDTPIGLRGETYVQLMMLNGGCLSCGYVYPGHNPSLNEFIEPGPSGGRGWMRKQVLPAPAAGVSYATIGVPAYAVWYVWVINGNFTTSAVAGNRQPQVFIDDTTSEIKRGTSQTQIANVVGRSHLWGAGPITEESRAGATVNNAMPWNQLLTGAQTHRIGFATPAIDVGDQWNAGLMIVEEWTVPT